MSEQKIAIYQEPAVEAQPVVSRGFPSASEFEEMAKMATAIADTEFVPTALRKRPEAVLACILAGREMGVGAMQALQSIHIIQGRPAPSAQLMRALVLSNGHYIATTEYTDDHVTVVGRRRGQSVEMSVTFGVAEAKRAQLAGKEGGNYTKYPRSMFLARATSELCRAIFPDVIAGFGYTPEEVSEFDAPAVNPQTGVISETKQADLSLAEQVAIAVAKTRAAMVKRGFGEDEITRHLDDAMADMSDEEKKAHIQMIFCALKSGELKPSDPWDEQTEEGK